MIKLASWMMKLYPKRWRARYGDELDALLADTGADARVVGDLFRGGMRMQLKTWPFLKLAFALGLLGLLVGVGIGHLIPAEYASQATLQLQPARISESQVGSEMAISLNEQIQELQTSVFSRTQLSRMIRSLDLYPDEVTKIPLEDVIEEMRRDTTVSFAALPGTLGKHASAFNIRFLYPDRYKAQQAVTALIAAFEAQNQAQQRTGPEAGGTTVVIALASLPRDPVFPNWPNVLLAAFLLGIAIAGMWRLTYRSGLTRKRFAFIAIAMGISGLAIAGAAYKLQIWPSQYQSTGALNYRNRTPTGSLAITNKVVSRTSLAAIINDPHIHLYPDEQRNTPLERIIDVMKKHISIRETRLTNGSSIQFSFEYPDRFKAQQTVSALMDRFARTEMESHQSASLMKKTGEVMDVLDSASLPVSPAKPNRYLIALTGCLAGLFLAAIISLIRRRWKPESDFPIDIVPE